MAIINGNYVPETLGAPQAVQEQVFGRYSKRDMSDMTTAAYNYLMKQQEQAHDLELWKMTNEYNLPSAQMQRYQDAGLNPNLIYSQQSQASAPPAFSAPTFSPKGAQARSAQNALNAIGQVRELAAAARETYDYLTYGTTQRAFQNEGLRLGNKLAQGRIDQQEPLLTKLFNEAYMTGNQSAWQEYLLTGQGGWQDSDGTFHSYSEGPQGQMYKWNTQIAQQNFERLKFMVSSIMPSQKARTDALTQLDKYQKEFMEGKYSAVLDIDLGLGETVNQWAKMILFMSLAKMF